MNHQYSNRNSSRTNTCTILFSPTLSIYLVFIYLLLGGCQTQESPNISTDEDGLDQAMRLDLGTQASDNLLDQSVDTTHSSCHEVDTESGCSESEMCQAGECVDPCADITCTEDMICMNGDCIPPYSRCNSFPQLDLDTYATDFGFETTISSAGDREQSDCIMNSYENGGDRTVSFTAPVAGTWLFTAKGFHLWSFSARTVCESTEVLACSRNVNYHGSDAFGSWQGFQVTMEEGESIYLNTDGCPLGLNMRCNYTVKATAPILEGESCDPNEARWRYRDDAINGCQKA